MHQLPQPAGRPVHGRAQSDVRRGAYGTLVGVRQRGTARRCSAWRRAIPTNSYLIHKLEGGPDIVGERMPRGTGPFLTDGQMLVIRRWIELGANND